MTDTPIKLEDIARLAGVSPMTVSRVLNAKPGVSESTRQKVMAAVQEMGYVPNPNARALAGNTTRVLGMLVPDFTTEYISEIARGAALAASSAGYELVLYTNAHQPNHINRHVTALTRGLIDGLMVVLNDISDEQLEALQNTGIKLAIIDHRHNVPHIPSVLADNYHGARRMMDHLFSLGHRKIAFITGRMDTVASLERLRGYQEALKIQGLEVREEWIMQGDFLQPSGFNATLELLQQKDPPTAIFAANDTMAIGAMDAARRLGFDLPTDLSIAGFDDVPRASIVHPNLTTVRQPLQEMGAAATRMVISMLSGVEITATQYELKTELQVRQSTAAPRQSD
ncbi:LacI family DNA-binding transcriptional regulator [Deinococcus cellulosilyticus]|uniref:LacI family transcriptional regulator n=1 Tax=Deinococcus cellulosilyticus (strain DSM 18568 / NBRC 106333 / KACC 11606 / 5516J-15) TaxID=1223518 RepID=A0A511N3B2_DEIC1|nr:LacI family DNA-binding transcriptional regulator [Deinococcus cellulosilyticus]GEM46906.1 LacI family transcriptional regulator [Deinococcus cellulosilyticus NBRC 106333 = KACC 11606]